MSTTYINFFSPFSKYLIPVFITMKPRQIAPAHVIFCKAYKNVFTTHLTFTIITTIILSIKIYSFSTNLCKKLIKTLSCLV